MFFGSLSARNRAIVFITVFALFLLPCTLLAELTSFAVVSDTHVGSQVLVYPVFIRAVEEQKIKVIIHTGDAIHDPGRSSQWERFFEITGSGKILHLAPGNHDIYGKASLTVYRQFFPELYYSIPDGDTLFVFLNTELPGEESMVAGEQLIWLESELQRPFGFKFVFLHEPLYPIFPRHGLDRHKKARDRLHSLFEKQGGFSRYCRSRSLLLQEYEGWSNLRHYCGGRGRGPDFRRGLFQLSLHCGNEDNRRILIYRQGYGRSHG